MTHHFAGTPPPPAPPDPVYDVLVPVAGQTYDLTLLGERVLGIYLHWLDNGQGRKKRARACARQEGGCPYCPEEAQWAGFLACLNNSGKTRVILRLGAESASDLVEHYWAPMAGLRGARLLVRRGNGRKGQALNYERAPLAAQQPLPGAHKLGPTLKLLLGGYVIDEQMTYGPSELAQEGGPG